MAPTSSARGPSRRAHNATCAPSAANLSAMAAPMPWLAPVTIATRPSSLPCMALVHLEQPRRTHPAADAHGHDHVTNAAAPPLDQRMSHEPRSAHAERVPDSDRAAVDVEPLVVDPETIATVERLHGEGLVQLPEPDIVDAEPLALEQPRYREDGSDAHLLGRATGDRHAAIGA